MLVVVVFGFMMYCYLFIDLFMICKQCDGKLLKCDLYIVVGIWSILFVILLVFMGSFFSFVIVFGLFVMVVVVFGGDQEVMMYMLVGEQVYKSEVL